MKEKFTVHTSWLGKAAVLLAFFGFLTLKCEAQLGIPPTITVQPSDQTVTNMGTVTFKVSVAANLSLTTHYQWMLNGVALKTSGSSGTKLLTLLDPTISYTQPNNTPKNAGAYSVKLTQTLGGTTVSSNANLNITTTPVAFSAAKPSADGFQLHLTGITGANFVVYASTNMVTWTPVYTNSDQTGSADYIDTAAAQFKSRFYKVVVQ
ncbi:MAG TPA: immunoglobulin domain-containing protein [Verrucomicrobiae bacterium]|jgi:hypothetical protein|nr:immunoglobulin domain-containing protein [Verrucomicrobiae bacterium]